MPCTVTVIGVLCGEDRLGVVANPIVEAGEFRGETLTQWGETVRHPGRHNYRRDAASARRVVSDFEQVGGTAEAVAALAAGELPGLAGVRVPIDGGYRVMAS